MSARETQEFTGEVEELSQVARQQPGWLVSLFFVTAGIALLAGGAHLAVEGAVALAQIIGLSDRVIGLTVVAIGTSLPEIVTSAVASYRGRDDVAIGNVIGSNMFNILGILGLSALCSRCPSRPPATPGGCWPLPVACFP